MAVGGLLLVILVLNAMPTKAYNSLRNAFYCENVMADLSQCEDYPGIIKIVNVDFPEENDYVCGNDIVHNRCLASEDDKRDLASVLGRKCNGKRVCNIHLAHGVYKGMHLPCRDLNISILIEIFFDCIYSPKIPEMTGNETNSTTEPSTTESTTVSLSTHPSSIFTSATVGASTAYETTATEASTTKTVWTRRRPKICNLTENIDEDDSDFLNPAPRVIFSFSCLVAQVLYLFTFLP